MTNLNIEEDLIVFDGIEKNSFKQIIKVIGVGGGGSNAVTNMYKEGIRDVSFIICNTDTQALLRSSVPIKIQLGKELTKGLGAGNDPRMGREAAKESLKDIEKILRDGTQMVFITAGMGGGTGTGAAPIIAELSKKLEILTVGIVTLPFRFEGKKRLLQALDGINELKKNVDALLIIDNERIKEVYGDTPAFEAFKKADKILTVAAKGIADIVTQEGDINVDFADVKNILKDSGIAIMGTGYGEGDNRAIEAADRAIHSPLLNFQNITGANKLLFFISYHPESPAITSEIEQVAKYIQEETKNIPDTIWGYGVDKNLKTGTFSVTIIATGFESNIDDYLEKLLKFFDTRNKNKGEVVNEEKEIKIPFEEVRNGEAEDKENYSEDEIYDIINNMKYKPLYYEDTDDIEKYETQPAYKRFGYTVVEKTTSREEPKLVTLTKNTLSS